MPLESIWADAPDEEPIKKQKPSHKRSNNNKKNNNSRWSNESSSNNKKKDSVNKVKNNKGNHESKTKNKIKETLPREKKPPHSQGKISPVSESLAINPFSQKQQRYLLHQFHLAR